MKYLILTLSGLSFLISATLFIKEFDIHELKDEFEYSKMLSDAQNSFNKESSEKIVCYRQTHRNFYVLILTLSISSLGFIFYAFEQKKAIAKKLELSNSEITKKNIVIEQQNTEILSAMEYSKQVQRAMLSNYELLKEHFKEHFIFYKPKSIVGGDFYWINKVESYVFIACIDCTGHGVGGAFMTILANSLLNQIILEYKEISPSIILEKLNDLLIKTFTNNGNERSLGGLDISIIRYCLEERELLISGAKRPVFIGSDDGLIELKTNKVSLGSEKNIGYKFDEQTRKMKKGDSIFMFTDGYPDQLGGENYKKYSSSKLNQLLSENYKKDMGTIRQQIKLENNQWKGINEQTDDILFIGLRV
jgi:serine phosphatase RsbU (regulator of sigma subunit)